jgi:hypothetical protein
MMMKSLVVVAALVAGGSASAQGKASSVMYFSSTCHGIPDCLVPSSTTFPNTNNYGTLASLALPAGHYFVTAKLIAYALNGYNFYHMECVLGDASIGNTSDLATSDFSAALHYQNEAVSGVGTTMYLQTPVSYTTRAGGTVKVACRVAGVKPDGVTPVEMHAAVVNISAVPFTTIVTQ